MKAIKHDKAVALLACGFMFAATAGLVVSGLNKSEEIAQTAGVESFEKVDSKEMNNVLSLERMDNILVGATLEDFYGASGMAGKETPEETTEEETTETETASEEQTTETETETQQETEAATAPEETTEAEEPYGVSEKYGELKNWYDGYCFGNKEIYNPWSVINYVSKGCVPQAYWVNTGKNEILEGVLTVADDDIIERLYALLQGESVIARIDQNVVYKSLSEDPANIYSLLLVAGYLKTGKKELLDDGTYLCEVSIPNKEIAAVYRSEVLFHLLQIGAITRTTANKIAESLYTNDFGQLQKAITEYMEKTISFYDAGAEGFYHGLVLGLIALMDNQYTIKSNRESGNGRYDICLFPKEKRHPGIIMELEWKNGLDENMLNKLSVEALSQINDKSYDTEMRELGIDNIMKLGIAFSGKKARIQTDRGEEKTER